MHLTDTTITVYGRATSSNVQAVMWTLAEIGLPVDRLDFGHSYGGTDTPDFLAMNPNGRVPVLTDGDLTMFESAAIVRYLAARYGGEAFWPEDIETRATLDIWAEWAKVTFTPVFIQALFFPIIRTPRSQVDPAVAAAGAEQIKPLAKMLSDRIGAGPWLGGEEFTYADIMAGYLLYRYFTIDFPRPDLPELAEYYARLVERPAFRENVMIDYEVLRPADPV